MKKLFLFIIFCCIFPILSANATTPEEFMNQLYNDQSRSCEQVITQQDECYTKFSPQHSCQCYQVPTINSNNLFCRCISNLEQQNLSLSSTGQKFELGYICTKDSDCGDPDLYDCISSKCVGNTGAKCSDSQPCNTGLQCDAATMLCIVPIGPTEVPSFELIEPELKFPIPTLPEFSKIQVEGDQGDRSLDIPWIFEYIAAVYKYGLVVAIALAILMIIIGGVIRIASAGQQKLISTSSSLITSALLGLIILLFSYVLLKVINPKIVDYQAIKIQIIEPEPLEFASFPDKQEGQITANSTSNTELDETFKNYAACINMDYRILKGIAFKESGLNPKAEHKSYKGLFQIGTSACAGANKKYNFGHNCSDSDLFDINTNVATGMYLIDMNFKSIKRACSGASLEDTLALIYFGHNLGPGSLSKVLAKGLCKKSQTQDMINVVSDYWSGNAKLKNYVDRIPAKINYSYATARTIMSFGATSLTPATKEGSCPLYK